MSSTKYSFGTNHTSGSCAIIQSRPSKCGHHNEMEYCSTIFGFSRSSFTSTYLVLVLLEQGGDDDDMILGFDEARIMIVIVCGICPQ